MKYPSSGLGRCKKPTGRRLHLEFLEIRLPLSSQTPVTDDPSSFVAGGDDAARARSTQEAISAVTTTAPANQFIQLIDPVTATTEPPQALLTEAGPLIGLPAFRNDLRYDGIDGSGFSVVVIDTGADLDHPFFGPDLDQNGVADRIVYNASFLGQSGSAEDGHGHGTHVASIVGSEDATYGGVAPGVNLIVLSVLNFAGSGTASSLEAALQWVVGHVDEYNIAGVNLSLGFNSNNNTPSTTPNLGLNDELAALAAMDVVVSSAAGNAFAAFGSAPGVTYPAADPNSLAVGAVWDADYGGPFYWAFGSSDTTTGPDRIASFSQRHPSLTTTFAPGTAVVAAGLGGGTAVMSGTSMSTPIVTGVVALMQQLSVQLTNERLSVAEVEQYVRDTGMPIFDGDDEDDNVVNSQQWYRRLDLYALGDAVYSGGLSNLTIPWGVELLTDSVPKGGTARLDFAIANQGVADTGDFSTAVYLSSDNVLDGGDTLLLDLTDNLAAGAFIPRSQLTAQIPNGTVPGSYYVIVSADDQANVAEGNEQNNFAVHPITITSPAPQVLLFDVDADAPLENESAELSFGEITQGSPDISKTLRLHNDGSTPLTTSSLTMPAGFSVTGFPQSVPPGTSVDFSVNLLGSVLPGVYFGEVSFQSNDPMQNPFSFEVGGSVIAPDDHGDNAGAATPILSLSATAGTLSDAGDHDWFSFVGEAGRSYRVAAVLGTLSDAVVRLVDVDGATGLDVAEGVDPAAIDWVAPADGVYYVEVATERANASGDYELRLLVDDDHFNNSLHATPIQVARSVAGDINNENDADWFVVSAKAGVEYRVGATVQTLGGARLRLIGPNGATELGVALASENVDAGINWTAPTSGDYYIEIIEATFTSATPSAESPTANLSVASGGSYDVIVTAVSRVPGDYNGDQFVNGRDFMIWQREVGITAPTTTTTLDTNGFEDFEELTLDEQHGWHQLGTPAGSAIVQSEVASTGSRSLRVQRASVGDNWWGVPLGPMAPVGDFVFVDWDMRVKATGAQNGALGPFMGVQAYDDFEGFGLLAALGVDATTLELLYQRHDSGPLRGVLTEAGRTLSSDTWYRFSIMFDFTAEQFTVFFEEQPLVTQSFVDLNLSGANLERLTDADIAALAAQADAASQSMTATAYVDNFRIFQATSADPFPSDGNYDGLVDAIDLAMWGQTFGVDYTLAAPQGAAAAVGTSAALAAPVGGPLLETLAVEAASLGSLAAYQTPATYESSDQFDESGLTHEVENFGVPDWRSTVAQDPPLQRRTEPQVAVQPLDRLSSGTPAKHEALAGRADSESRLRQRLRYIDELENDLDDARCAAAVDAAFDAW